MFIATIVACWTRITRGIRAIPWGIPEKLETEGIYRWIRHPLYTSYFLYYVGFMLVFQSLIFLPLFLGIPGYYWTSLFEEELLVTHFGEQYLNYQEIAGRFFPYRYRERRR